jgi:hypothetical protein
MKFMNKEECQRFLDLVIHLENDIEKLGRVKCGSLSYVSKILLKKYLSGFDEYCGAMFEPDDIVFYMINEMRRHAKVIFETKCDIDDGYIHIGLELNKICSNIGFLKGWVSVALGKDTEDFKVKDEVKPAARSDYEQE